MKTNRIKVEDISKPSGQLTQLDPKEFMELPYPYNTPEAPRPLKQLTEEVREKFESDLDVHLAVKIPKPKNKEEEERLVNQFLEGLRKLLSKENNWTFLMPLMLSLEYCAKCQTCNDACPVYESSGKKDIYRPIFRAEVLRKIA